MMYDALSTTGIVPQREIFENRSAITLDFMKLPKTR